MDTKVVEILTQFFSQFPRQEGKKGTILIHANSQPTGIFYIEEGIIRRYWITEKGEEITLNLYKPHAFLPMSWAVSDVPNQHYYEAMTDVVLRKAPKAAVLSFIQREPEVLYDLLRRVYIGMEGLWTHFESLTTGSSHTKLLSSLIILAKRFGKKENATDTVIHLFMTESDLANYAGMSRETVSRELQKLKKNKLLDFSKGTITLHNLSLLEQQLSL